MCIGTNPVSISDLSSISSLSIAVLFYKFPILPFFAGCQPHFFEGNVAGETSSQPHSCCSQCQSNVNTLLIGFLLHYRHLLVCDVWEMQCNVFYRILVSMATKKKKKARSFCSLNTGRRSIYYVYICQFCLSVAKLRLGSEQQADSYCECLPEFVHLLERQNVDSLCVGSKICAAGPKLSVLC